jgi:hypothetical protein
MMLGIWNHDFVWDPRRMPFMEFDKAYRIFVTTLHIPSCNYSYLTGAVVETPSYTTLDSCRPVHAPVQSLRTFIIVASFIDVVLQTGPDISFLFRLFYLTCS